MLRAEHATDNNSVKARVNVVLVEATCTNSWPYSVPACENIEALIYLLVLYARYSWSKLLFIVLQKSPLMFPCFVSSRFVLVS